MFSGIACASPAGPIEGGRMELFLFWSHANTADTKGYFKGHIARAGFFLQENEERLFPRASGLGWDTGERRLEEPGAEETSAASSQLWLSSEEGADAAAVPGTPKAWGVSPHCFRAPCCRGAAGLAASHPGGRKAGRPWQREVPNLLLACAMALGIPSTSLLQRRGRWV